MEHLDLKFFQRILLTVILAFALGLPGDVGAKEATKPQVLAQYVLMGFSEVEDRTVPLVRVVLAQPTASCPQLVFSDGQTPRSMQVRRNPNPAAFGVVVCEAQVADLPAGVTVQVEGQTGMLPVPNAGSLSIKRLVVLGDSGCKGGSAQPCGADGQMPTAWPFPEIISHATEQKPDLVIHVGDYNYRGTPSKTGAGEWSYDGCLPKGGGPLVRQSSVDTWTTWDEDFFTPAGPLLAAAPWAVVRGNHELCSRAGEGWFYFLDPHSQVLNPYEPTPDCSAPTALTRPYRLSFENLDLVMLDTANACGGEDPQGESATAYEERQYMLQLSGIAALLAGSEKPAWLVGHRPIWSLYQQEGQEPSTENQTLQPALRATPLGELPPQIKMVLSGHMHQFQSMSFAGKRPPQLVIGNSGVKASGNSLSSSFQGQVDGMRAAGLSITGFKSHGYLNAELQDGSNWQGTVPAFDATGTALQLPLATCGLPIKQGRLCVVP